MSTRLYTPILSGSTDGIEEVLDGTPRRFWRKILGFACLYYKVQPPKNISSLFRDIGKGLSRHDFKQEAREQLSKIIEINKLIAEEFIKGLNAFRLEKVSQSNLELEHLYRPFEFFAYLKE